MLHFYTMNPPFDTVLFGNALSSGNIVWRKHTLERMLERNISREEVLIVMEHGEIIQVYDYDKPFPSMLMLGFPEKRPLHVVASFDETNQIAFVITAYEPDLSVFEPDFKTKRK
ncbi:MAG: DUF4258 domain-containing protein [Saprospiraceae bacterium]